MRICCLQHVPFETPAYFTDWAETRNFPIHSTRLFQAESLPQLDEFDLLVVLGGPMSVNDENLYPWLTSEKKLISSAISSKKRIIGVCLGAQLIASSFGCAVYRNKEREIGWHNVSLTPAAQDSCLRFLTSTFSPFHWHGETFDLPKEALLLASSEGCVNQAFAIGANILALQFHLEVTAKSIEDLIENCKDDIKAGKYVQDADTMRRDIDRLKHLHHNFEKILDSFCSV